MPAGGDPPGSDVTEPEAATVLADVVREHGSRLASSLVSLLGDFSAAEDLVSDAVEKALRTWPLDGVPEQPQAWLFTVARRRGLDVLRREANYRDKLRQLQWPVYDEPDDRLRLMFTCCHPALSREAQVALTLRMVCGLSAAQLAKAFLLPEATVAQRITRAKRKISQAGIPYRVPSDDELGSRLTEVLAVIYLLFNEGYLATEQSTGRDLAIDAEWLATLTDRLLPGEPEVMGLVALIRLHRARAAARFDPSGRIVLLRDQDRARWDHAAIDRAVRLLTEAGRLRRPGPYQLQAAIVACHAEAESWADTDWPQIVVLYDMLLHLAPSPVIRLHRAIALARTDGAQAALTDVDELAAQLATYHLFHATRAELLRELGRDDEAVTADQRALELTRNPAEQAVLEARLGLLGRPDRQGQRTGG
ncbi:RNA polymerase sigma factor [Nocardia cyriacigeorgica]|uniref:RNA polymerase sigma factor n=1 Tax=Nocardia cyriacigeorgica TaxID=135487 RepID=A0A6P1DG24_9NOCA|nr:RNA polymerase sigma factor [Nocardia cyriacigeorgica]NEW48144.1 RNA polymerase sigma factor [Nocardia cyriacigeorgica]NEW51614.1 RNA polymerase sigma factor [Nocardia cyriacigeorgica]NEW57751.1 RNA polymerase sigma factor [Nocardia cyriacigeorgica]